jgi:hypothetical protein
MALAIGFPFRCEKSQQQKMPAEPQSSGIKGSDMVPSLPFAMVTFVPILS